MDKRLHIWEKAALCALCLTLLSACRLQGEREALAEGLIRLHVIAVSDEPEEQALKLRVRNAVLAYLDPLLEGASDQAEAEERLFDDLSGVALAAASAAEGRQVTVTLGTAHYPRRSAESFALPAGSYESLRVTLGEGEGHNWWGLVFPQIALGAAEGGRLRETLAGDGYVIAEPEDYELRFFLLDAWDSLVNRLQGDKSGGILDATDKKGVYSHEAMQCSG